MIKNRFALTAVLAISLLGLLSGCQSDGGEGGIDMGFIRPSDPEKEKAPVVNEAMPLLFPTGKERDWKLDVSVFDQAADQSAKTVQQFQEIVRVDNPRTIGGVASATTLTMYKKGTAYRNEIYQVKPETLSLVAAGGNDKMVMSPPMLLLRTKAPEGEEYPWEGNITFQKATAPAQAYSRVHALEEVMTPAGKFNAYRVDTTMTTIISGQTVTFPSSRWFVPGIGIVKQTFRVGNSIVVKTLTSYKSG